VITITGHHLEWISISPRELRPADAVITRALLGLKRKLSMLGELSKPTFKTTLPCSHAARAVCLMRHSKPFAEWDRLGRSDDGQQSIPLARESER